MGELLSVVRRVGGLLLRPVVVPFQILRGEINAVPVIALGILGALVFFAVRTLRGDRTSAVFLASFSTVWVLFNGPFEGPTLVVLSWSHGLTAAI